MSKRAKEGAYDSAEGDARPESVQDSVEESVQESVRKQREKRKTKGGEGYLWTLRKRRGSRRRALPDRAPAKPGGADRTTEITTYSGMKNLKLLVTIQFNKSLAACNY